MTIAEQVNLALAGDFVPFAVNVAAGEVSETVRPFMAIAEQLGSFFAGLHDALPSAVEVICQGELAGTGTGILTLSILKGIFGAVSEEPVSFVNAPAMAKTHGLEIKESSTMTAQEFVSLIEIRSDAHSVAGTLLGHGHRVEPKIVMVDDHYLEVTPTSHMLVVRNDDRPGMIGQVGVALGAAGVSISSMAVGPNQDAHSALMVLTTDLAAPDETLATLQAADGISAIHRISL